MALTSRSVRALLTSSVRNINGCISRTYYLYSSEPFHPYPEQQPKWMSAEEAVSVIKPCKSCVVVFIQEINREHRRSHLFLILAMGTTVHNPEDTIIGCNRRMFDKQLACDVKFKVGQSKSPVGAHKYVLSARSDVFFTMFNGSVPQGADVDVPDIEPGPFNTFLRYLYCDEELIDSDNVLSVLYCCKKYNVQSLLTKCIVFVKKTMSVDNVCSLLEQAHFFDEQQLYQSCLSFIHQQGASVLKTDGFQELSRACVFDVISSDSLACKERFVFEAMLRWAEAECKRQSKHVQDSTMRVVLGELVFQIRFGLLDMSYYSAHVSTRKILDDAEKLELFQAISGTTVRGMKFNGKQRNCPQRCESRRRGVMISPNKYI